MSPPAAVITPVRAAGWVRPGPGVALLLLLTGLLAVPCLRGLWAAWRSESSLSHGPLVLVVAGVMLWTRRQELRDCRAASGPGLALSVGCCLLCVAADWADLDFLKPLALLGLATGLVWFLAGPTALRACGGALGFLLFLIPWPTALTDRLGLPLQLASSAYAAQFAGMLGVPIVRAGVQLAVVPYGAARPVYEIVVAQQCSGLTSLVVLLALGYLVACFTPAGVGWRAVLIALVVPLTLFLNALRLTLVLLAGAHGHPLLARWIHDHEQPLLVLLCSCGLLGLRQLLLGRLAAVADAGRHAESAVEPVRGGQAVA